MWFGHREKTYGKAEVDMLLDLIHSLVDNSDKKYVEKMYNNNIHTNYSGDIRNRIFNMMMKKLDKEPHEFFTNDSDLVRYGASVVQKFPEWEKYYNSLKTTSGKEKWVGFLVNQVNNGKLRAKVQLLNFLVSTYGEKVFYVNPKKKELTSNVMAVFAGLCLGGDPKKIKQYMPQTPWFNSESIAPIRWDLKSDADETLSFLLGINFPLIYKGKIENKEQFELMYSILTKYGIRDRERCSGKRGLMGKLIKFAEQDEFNSFTQDEVDEFVTQIWSWNRAAGVQLASRFKKEKTSHIYTMLKV